MDNAIIIWDVLPTWGGRTMRRDNNWIDQFCRAPKGTIENYYLVTPWGPMCLEQLR